MTKTLNPSGSTNGRSRKSLADQIDRLDHVLDGLADGLNEAVASAVKQAVPVAVQEAVRGILAEVLTNPDLLAKLLNNIGLTIPANHTPAPPAPAVVRTSVVAKVTGTIGAWFGAGWRAVRNGCGALASKIGNTLTTTKRRWQLVRQFRVSLLTAGIIGAVAGLIAYCGGPYVAALAGCVAGFTATLTVQAGIWLRHWLDGSPLAEL